METTFEQRRQTCYGAILKYCTKLQGLADPPYGYEPTPTVGFKTPEGHDYVMHVVYTDDVNKTFDRTITTNTVIQSRIDDYISYWNSILAFVVNIEMAGSVLQHPEYFTTLRFDLDPTTGMAYITGLSHLPHRIGLEWSYINTE